ncbi:MAG TPA: TRAP transporter large permease subunit [Deltaproteobacteria bacterium]|nr:TRAP transporter large permease subunit [Deltaproteobacteria bacterium]
MSIELLTALFFGSLLFFIFLGVPLTFVLGGLSLVFLFFTWGPASFFMVPTQILGSMSSFSLVAIPLFILMAMLLERSGVADDLYQAMYLWFGKMPGGLAIGTLAICAVFAAMCGVTAVAVVTMGSIALPSMLKLGYDKKLIIGCINTGGGWGILIPPSILMIIYAMIAGESVGKMFAGGVFPGLLLFVLVSIFVAILCYFRPELGPPLPPEDRVSLVEKIRSLKSVILPILIIVLVMGAILAGIATPTEAAALGVVGAVIATVAHKKLTWKLFSEANINTLKQTGMIMWIIFAAHCFNAAYQSMQASQLFIHLMEHIPGGPWGTIIFIQITIFIFAMVLDPVGIMMIALPVYLPVVAAYGFDPLWFGVLFIINLQIGYMTPPFGFNLFYTRSIVPPSVTMGDIYLSVIPFVLISLVGLAVVMIFPGIVTWLPAALF